MINSLLSRLEYLKLTSGEFFIKWYVMGYNALTVVRIRDSTIKIP